MKLIRWGTFLVLLVTYLFTIALYPTLPDVIASHWDASGMTNGYMPKFWGLIIIPLIMTACVGLFTLLPRIDPLRSNYAKFRNYYEGFVFIFAIFMLAIQLQVILWNSGHPVSPNLIIPFFCGILFIAVGSLIEHAEPNWFAGIRTPWTLSDPLVWKKTNERGGKLFKLAGVISCCGVLVGAYAIWFVIAPILIVTVYTVVYSYAISRDNL
ncbi:MAG: SdpI family protein [Methanoregula sp.]|jgi:uncharacterized membrane protein